MFRGIFFGAQGEGMARVIKLWLTRFAKRLRNDLDECNNILTESENLSGKERDSKLRLIERRIKEGLLKLENKDKEYKEFLLDLTGEERKQAEEDYEEYATQKNDYLTVIINASDAIRRINEELLVEEDQKIKEDEERGRLEQKHVKLPRITLPMYDGDPLEWEEFWNAFEVAVDNQDLSPGQKFSYLTGCLKGDAHKAVAGLRIVDQNYEEAKTILKRRFEDPSVIKRSLCAQLKAIPRASGSTAELRRVFVEIDRLVRQLKTSNKNINQAMIILEIEEKFPVYFLFEVKKRGNIENSGAFEKIDFQITIREKSEDVVHKREVRIKHEKQEVDAGKAKIITLLLNSNTIKQY